MTRAKHGLYIYVNPNTKNDKATMGSLLQTTIAKRDLIASSNTISFEAGDPKWYLRLKSEKPKVDSTLAKKAVQPTLFDYDDDITSSGLKKHRQVKRKLVSNLLRRRQALVDSIAPSGLVFDAGVHHISDRQTDNLLKPVTLLGAQTTVAALEGTIEHAWFAKLSWEHDTKNVEKSYREIAAAAIDRQHWSMVDIEVLWKRWLKHLKQRKIKALLNPTRYSDKLGPRGTLRLEMERRFATIIKHKLIQGSVDRLVLAVEDDHVSFAEIIDFKTDYCPNKEDDSTWISEQRDKYRPQLAAYAELVAKTYKLSRSQIRTTLALLDVGEVCDVSASV
jgi:ATP-dependent exoDNAse (exonuclease V) beta subunit